MSNDGGPAFPAAWEGSPVGTVIHQGMTLRDYFAAKAMQSALVGASLPGLPEGDPDAVAAVELVAMAAYRIADAMLAERAK